MFTCVAHRPSSVSGPDKLQQVIVENIGIEEFIHRGNPSLKQVSKWASGGEVCTHDVEAFLEKTGSAGGCI